MLERLLRGGAATLGELAKDLDASRQQVARTVNELALLDVLKEEQGSDKRAVLVAVNEGHPFIQPLRILAIDGGAWYETPEAWQTLLAKRFKGDWYVGGYAAIRRVMQPTDFEAPSVLVNIRETGEERLDVAAALERACRIQLKVRRVDAIPPEVVPVDVAQRPIWYATPARGFVEAWRTKEIPLYGLMLCFVQGLHDGVFVPIELLSVGRGERMEAEMRTLLAATPKTLLPEGLIVRPGRALKPNERKVLDQALNTTVG